MTIDLTLARALTGSKPLTPPRRPASVRRTATMEASWPDGTDAPTMITGRCRDIRTDEPGGPPMVLDHGSIVARVTGDRIIHSIEADPEVPGLDAIVGFRAGGRLREKLRHAVASERRAGTPVYQLLDDLSGLSLIAGTAFMAWPDRAPGWFTRRSTERSAGRRMEGVCIGLQPGSGGLTAANQPRPPLATRTVADLVSGSDRIGWHDFDRSPEVSMRRARRIDIWQSGGTVFIDSAFQDKALTPHGTRIAIHEYAVRASADAQTMTLKSIDAEPHVLPFAECPLAPAKLEALLGSPVRDLRDAVLAHLKGTAGCTHLNDAVRALADVPVLIRSLA